ncbi:MAG: hypothetical protein QOH10_703 [Actinomycetota bacterium]|jgi:hypothetical protein|nr:hypothetical protein [Actinomycetota bacterium]
MRPTFRRAIAALTTPLLAGSLLLAATTTASASATSAAVGPAGTIPFNYWVDASTTLAKLGQTVTVPRGTFKGTIDIATFNLTGSIKLPPASAVVAIAGLPLATATFKIAEVQPVTGHIDLSTLTVTATSVFKIRLVSLTPVGLPFVNLVGDSCRTSKPVSVTMSGSFTPPLVFSGIYTIPPLRDCGASTAALNLVVPGPGNTFTAVATPKG